MSVDDIKSIQNPPRIIHSLVAGFEVIANHVSLIIFPIVLDLFLWFAPHLRIQILIENFFKQLLQASDITTAESLELIQQNREIWSQAVERLNLFAILRSYPVGISSLMVALQPIKNPLGIPLNVEITSLSLLLVLLLVIGFTGLLFGSIYFATVAEAVSSENIIQVGEVKNFFQMLARVILLSVVWLGILTAVSIPASCLISGFIMGGFNDIRLGWLLVGGMFAWLIFPMLFSPHGIFVLQKSVWSSIMNSLRLARFTFPSMVLLFLLILLIGEGLNMLWRVPGEGSWLTLIGIAGHAFVTTALLAATFVYYQDANLWVEKFLLQLKTNP